MFKCCVCQGKASRRASQEEDSEREMDEEDEESSSSSSSSDDEEEDENSDDEEEREIEEDLAKKFKCQTPNGHEVVVVAAEEVAARDAPPKEPSEEVAVVEVNGDVRGPKEEEESVDREAIKENVVEILNCAAKIVQDLRRGERERLEKIKEESGEDTTVESSPSATGDAVAAAATAEKIDGAEEKKPELEKVESDETEEEVITVIEEEEGEYEILEEIKRNGSQPEKSKTDQIEEMIIEELINDLNEEADNDQEQKEIVESRGDADQQQRPVQTSNEQTATEARPNESIPSPENEEEDEEEEVEVEPPPPGFCEVEIIDEIKKTEIYKIEGGEKDDASACRVQRERLEVSVYPNEADAAKEEQQEPPPPPPLDDVVQNGDLLNIPPPVTPPPEELERLNDEGRAEMMMDFPTPPPIDFDVAAPEDEEGLRLPSPPPPAEELPACGANGRAPPVPPWEDELGGPAEAAEIAGPLLLRQLSKTSSPGSKSLPSPPSSSSDNGNETELESKSSGDEQTARVIAVPAKQRAAYDEPPDDDGDDSVFETVSLDKDPDIKDIPPRPVPPVPRWLSQEEDEPETSGSEGFGGMQEPPATPVARDELALRRHRFFSDLLQAARNTAEHRVSFDPLGPRVHPGCEHDDREEHLEELVNRLESVTKRLEQVSAQPLKQVTSPAVQTQEIAVQTKSPSPERSLSLTEELPPEESSQSSSSSRGSTLSSVASVVEVVNTRSMSVAGYEGIIAGPVKEYIQLSQKIGGDVAEHCKLVEKAFQIQLQFLKTAASRPAPGNQSEQVSLLAPTSTQIQAIQDYREKHRPSSFFNHLSAISESIPALGWVAVSPTPAPYVKEMNDAGQFYTNRVLKDWKEKDKTHVEWCKAWVKTLTDLQQFVRQHHTTGLVWAKTGTVPSGGAPPPPPPICKMPMADPVAINDDRSALFAEINQGENITKNLKKVTSDMQTHKNTNLRTGPAPFKAPVVSNNASPVKVTLPANAPIDKPPVFTRDGKKWLVEFHKGNKELLIDNAEMNNVVYMFRCQESSLVIKGKVNSVVMDSCRKSAVVVDSVVASIEFVNCQSVQMQVLGKVPTISVDKTDGCQMYLNKDTLDVELITSKSSEMNVMVPVGNNDYTEYPVPEQFKTVITKKGLSTTAVDSLG